jgi:hypothetical protein
MDKSRSAPNKKRHHYVPVSYLSRFTDEEGYLYAYRKDDPGRCLRSRPEAIGFQKYYYSQPLPEGGYDHNRFEDGLADLEGDWADLAARLSAGERVKKEDVSYLLGFAALQRVRVPATRDLAERALAHEIMKELRGLDAAGALDPKPPGLENILDLIQVTIDPHKSMEAMALLLPHLGPILDSIGYQIIHNRTGLSFITSDNPVSYFDPSVRETLMQPYRVHVPKQPMELLFPIDPWTMLRGHSDDRHRFARKGLKHVEIKDLQAVRRMNRITAKFAYELIISADTEHETLVRAFAALSPVLDASREPPEHVFGVRQKKPKWKG